MRLSNNVPICIFLPLQIGVSEKREEDAVVPATNTTSDDSADAGT